MPIAPFIPLITSAVSAGAQLFGQHQNNQNIQDANRQNYEYALDMWNKNNEYMSPVNQIARYKQAGLNPALMYGQVNNASPATPNMNYQAKHFDTQGLSQNIQNIGSSILQSKQSKLMDADYELKIVERSKSLAETTIKELEQDLVKAQTSKNKTEINRINIEISQIKRNLFEQTKTFQDRFKAITLSNTDTQETINLKIQQIESEILKQANLRSSTNLNKQQLSNLRSQNAKTLQEIKNFKINAVKTIQDIEQLKIHGNLTKANILLTNLKSEYQTIQNHYSKRNVHPGSNTFDQLSKELLYELDELFNKNKPIYK